MPYAQQLDFTSKGLREKREEESGRTPFEERKDDDEGISIDDLPPSLRKAMDVIGWDSLMQVQSLGIPYILEGRDLVVQSKTGSGKTGAFLLPMLDALDADQNAAQALVLCPTRELAKQIHAEFETMSDGHDLRAVAVYGGTAYGPQIKAFKSGAQLVIGTPGRVLDHLEKGTLRFGNLRMLVLDEADEMLSMGFYPDMLALKRYLPDDRLSTMFSATMPFPVQRIGQEFLDDPVFLAPQGDSVHVEQIAHRIYHVDRKKKDRTLASLIEWENPASALIFANTRREVDYLAQYLSNLGYDVAAISSDFSQKQREKVMGRLKAGKLRLLVATDVAARGIDIMDLSHVFQYDLPRDREYFVHRSGRTARAGKSGVSVSFVASKEDEMILRDIVQRYEIPLETLDPPTDDELAQRVGERLTVLLEDRMRNRSNLERERAARFIPVATRLVEKGEPELLAMLLDDAYYESLQEAKVPLPE